MGLVSMTTPTPVDPCLRLHVLTGEVHTGDVRRHRLSPRRLALLVALARRRAATPRAQLLDEIWGEQAAQDEDGALNAFNVCLFHLRRILGDGVIIQGRGGYRLGEAVWVDLWDIERIVGEVRGKECLSEEEHRELQAINERLLAPRPSFYADWSWFEPADQRITELLAEISVRLAREVLRQGRPLEALSIARSLIERDPCDEPAHEIEIRAYLALGDEPSAYRAYRHYRKVLAQELGVAPSRSLQQMLSGSYELTPA